MLNKKQLLIDYLDSNLFIPIMYSPHASHQLKYDLQHTRSLFNEFSAEGIINYIWNMLGNKEVEMILSNRLMDEGFYNYKQVINEFKHEFTYDWLMS